MNAAILSAARLADAAYADLSYDDAKTPAQNRQRWEDLLAIRLTASEGALLASRYPVISQFSHPSGLSVTLFKDAQGNATVAIRGTEGLSDFIVDGVLAVGVPPSLNPQFVALQGQLAAWSAPTPGLNPEDSDQPPLLPATFSVTGHSLGGYLAAAVKASMSARVTDAYLFNAPGIGSVIGSAASLFQQAFGTSVPGEQNVWSIRASEGPSMTSALGTQVSPPMWVQTEPRDSANPFPYHYMGPLRLGIAVELAFTTAFPALSRAELTACIDAFGATGELTFESAISFLRSTVNGVAGQLAPNDNNAVMTAIGDILNFNYATSPRTALVLNGMTTTNVADKAALTTDVGQAVRYALSELSPIAVIGGTPPASASLSGRSTEYWTARAMLLERKLWFSTNDLAPVTQDIPRGPDGSPSPNLFQTEATYFEDKSTGYKISQGPIFNNATRYLFGSSESGVSLTGGLVADFIFGGTGDETLSGLDGIDRLEGFDGKDVLNGGLGADLLFGGAGADWLGFSSANLTARSEEDLNSDGNTYDGGTGNDMLSGTHGADTIVFRAGDGQDTLWTNGGLDQLTVQGTGAVTFEHTGTDLKVWVNREDSAGSGDYTLVKDWFTPGSIENMLNTVAANGVTYSRDQVTTLALHVEGSNDPNVNDVIDGTSGFSDVINGNAGDDFIDVSQSGAIKASDTVHGGSGNDHLYGSDSNDFLYGDADDDFLNSGAGIDTVEGGAGNDELRNTGGADTLVGGRDDDSLYNFGDASTFVWGAGDGNDVIHAARQDDTLRLNAATGDAVSADRNGANLVLGSSQGGSVTVEGWFEGRNRLSVETPGGHTWTAAEIDSHFSDAKWDIAYSGSAVVDASAIANLMAPLVPGLPSLQFAPGVITDIFGSWSAWSQLADSQAFLADSYSYLDAGDPESYFNWSADGAVSLTAAYNTDGQAGLLIDSADTLFHVGWDVWRDENGVAKAAVTEFAWTQQERRVYLVDDVDYGWRSYETINVLGSYTASNSERHATLAPAVNHFQLIAGGSGA